MNLTFTIVNYDPLKVILFSSWSIWIFLWVDFLRLFIPPKTKTNPALILFLFFNLILLVFSIIWQETVLTHIAGVLEFVKEQQCLIESHIIPKIFGQ